MPIITHVTFWSLVKMTGIALAVIVVWILREILFIIFLAFLLASTSKYIAQKIEKETGITQKVGIFTSFGVLLLAFVGVLMLLVPAVITEGVAFAQFIQFQITQLESQFLNSGVFQGIENNPFQGLAQLIPEFGQEVIQLVQNSIELITFALLTIILGLYMALDPEALHRFVAIFVPKTYKSMTSTIMERTEHTLGRWAVNQMLVALFVGGALYLILNLTSMRYITLFSVLWGISEFIPFIGPFLIGIGIVSLTFSLSPILGILVFISLITIQVMKHSLFVPLFVQSQAQLNPLVVLLSLMIGGAVTGLFGLVVATPLMSIITLLKEDFERYVNIDVVQKIINE